MTSNIEIAGINYVMNVKKFKCAFCFTGLMMASLKLSLEIGAPPGRILVKGSIPLVFL